MAESSTERYEPRLKTALPRRACAPQAERAVRLHERDAGAAARQDRAQHGRRRSGGAIPRRSQSAADGPRHDRRPEAGDHQGAQVDRHLQAARGHADRRQGHAAQGPHVRVPRPADHHRAAARARLPRPEPEELRRPRQLRHGHEGAHRVPGDQLRQDRPDLGHGHHRLHHGEDRRRGAGAARGFKFPFRSSEPDGTGEDDDMAKKSSIEKQQAAQAAGEAVRGQARRAEGDRRRRHARRWRSASRRA